MWPIASLTAAGYSKKVHSNIKDKALKELKFYQNWHFLWSKIALKYLKWPIIIGTAIVVIVNYVHRFFKITIEEIAVDFTDWTKIGSKIQQRHRLGSYCILVSQFENHFLNFKTLNIGPHWTLEAQPRLKTSRKKSSQGDECTTYDAERKRARTLTRMLLCTTSARDSSMSKVILCIEIERTKKLNKKYDKNDKSFLSHL